MCIAAIINSPISKVYLDEMHQDNPHGAGVAWFADNQLHFRRGLDADAVWDMQQKNELTYPYLLHFRWATHGDIVPELTHPFPVGLRALMGELQGTANALLIHNGVWNGCTAWLDMVRAPQEIVKAVSDTAIAAYLLGVYPATFEQKLNNIPWAVAVARVKDGKLHIKKYGYTWTSWGGNEYSNLQWLPAGEWWEGNSSKWKSSYDSDKTDKNPYYTPITRRSYNSVQEAWRDWGEGSDYNPDNKKWEGQDFLDDYMSSKNPVRRRNAAEIVKCFDSWEEYVRARYGDDVANAIANDGQEPELPDDELVSEESAVVNAYLERLERDREDAA